LDQAVGERQPFGDATLAGGSSSRAQPPFFATFFQFIKVLAGIREEWASQPEPI
jgi:hypothetical protein